MTRFCSAGEENLTGSDHLLPDLLGSGPFGCFDLLRIFLNHLDSLTGDSEE